MPESPGRGVEPAASAPEQWRAKGLGGASHDILSPRGN